MSNSNCVSALYGGLARNKILPQTLTTNTETEFQIGNDFNSPSIAVIALPSQNVILGVQSSVDQTVNSAILGGGTSAVKNRPVSNTVYDFTKPFLLRLCGTYQAIVSNTVLTLRLYNGTSKSGTVIATAGPVTNTTAPGLTFGFILEAELHWDSSSQILRGQFYYDLNPFYQTYTATAPATVASIAGLTFCASAQFGAGGGTATVSELSLTQL